MMPVSEQPETPRVSPPPAISQSSIVVVRLLLLVVAAVAVFAAIAIGFREQGVNSHEARFVCPMHPEVRSATRSECPICRMKLEPIGGLSDARSKGHSGMSAMPDMTAFENVRKHKIIEFVRVHSLLPVLREIRGWARVENDHEIAAIFYRDQIDALGPEEHGTFSLTASPKNSIPVTRTQEPAVLWDRSTSMIRFRVDDNGPSKGGNSIQAGQVGWLRVADKARAVLGVSESAVLQAPEGPYVLAWAGGERFEKRPVELGETFSRQGFAVVLSGLRVNELVVSRATFFVDADRRLNGGKTGEIAR
jgi:hypothetical protein